MIVERNVPARMRDGVTLRADVYRPEGDGRHPALLLRLPYGKDFVTDFGDHEFFVPRGYVVIVQDGRGRFASEGEFTPLFQEIDDGYDTVEWAARLPYCDGQVGTIGQSYLGATQYLLSHARPPHLRCQVPVSASADFHESWVYHTGGAFVLGWQVPYAIFLARETIDRKGLRDELWPRIRPHLERSVNFANPLTPEAYRRLPLTSWADLLHEVAPYLADYLGHPDDGPFWWPINGKRQHRNVSVPMLHVSSWYDIFSRDAIENYNGLRTHAMTPQARGGQRLLLGPWGHLFPYTSPTSKGAGDADFGEAALLDFHEYEVRFLDYWLKGIDDGFSEEAPIRLFTMRRNSWRDEWEWPLARTRWTPLYLHSGGNANTAGGDGRLGPETAADEPPDRFTYDPGDPVPTTGGNLLVLPIGVKDQRSVEQRPDVLVYTGQLLDDEVEVTGPVSVVLYASSSCPDTDFTAKLVDVHPDGYAANVTDGIIRCRYRESPSRPTPLRPGEVVELHLDLWSTSHVFAAGHRIRIEVSSSNFPRFDRNLNTGGDQATGTTWNVARQEVHHSGRFRSHLLLPVIG
jgi:uncharacterized protein